MTEETKQLIIGQLQAYYEEFEAQVRFLEHQAQQPQKYQVFEGSREELQEQLETAKFQRDQYLKALEEIQPTKAILPPWQSSKPENT